MQPHLRIARPVSALERSVVLYCRGLGLTELGRFAGHDGFDGVMLGKVGLDYHFEFTYCRAHPVRPNHTPEDLIVFYLPDRDEWQRRCEWMLDAGFTETPPFNPYWRQRGRTFEDHDGYRVVLQRGAWQNEARARSPDQLSGPTAAYRVHGSAASNAGGQHALRRR